MGLFSEQLIIGGNFAFQNGLHPIIKTVGGLMIGILR